MSRYLKTFVPITLVILLVGAFFTFRGEAQQPKNSRTAAAKADKPISGTAVAFAESDEVRDLPDASSMDAATADGTAESDVAEGRAVNEFNGRMDKVPNAASAKLPSLDAALAGRPEGPSLASAVGAPITNFDGMDDIVNVPLFGFRVAPSDENVAVGPNDVVQTVNLAFRIYSKTGVPKLPAKQISKLFAKLGGACANFDQGDPIVLHDRIADRWVITQFDFEATNVNVAPPFHECIAVSKGSDPAGAYYMYDFVTPGTDFPDYPHLGTWPDGYYMTVNQFKQPSGAGNGVGMYAFDRTKMLVGDPTAAFIYFNLDIASHPEGFNATQPSDFDGFQLPAPGTPNTFAYVISDEFEDPPFNVDALRLFDFHADFVNPANASFKERAESPLAMAAFDPRFPSGRNDIKQPAPANTTTDPLDAIGYHLMYRLQYRKSGTNENLVGSFPVNVSGANPTTIANYQAGIRYFQIQKTTPAGAYTMFDQATFSPDAGNPATGLNRWLPSAAIDVQGNLAVSYSGSSTSVFPSIYYAGRDFNAAGIPAAGLSTETTLFTGTGSQLGSSHRWGDYQSLQVDPSDDCTFWTTNQYYNVSSSFNWRTRIGSFKFPTCTAPPQGTLTGTVTACDTGAPLANVLVQVSNGFSTATGPDGKYSMKIPAPALPGPPTGFVYTVTFSNGARNCTQSGPFSAIISDQETTTLDACLNGTAKPIVDTQNPLSISISGGNGNGIVDANECNTLNLQLTNVGCSTAHVVSAVLTTNTPGVTINPPGNSTYQDIPVDGVAANQQPYRFTTSPGFACGTPINFTLTTTFNGGQSVSTFSLPTCTETQATQTMTGTLTTTDSKTPGNGRLTRDAGPSLCNNKACPGSNGAVTNNAYDVVGPFVNTGPNSVCATITVSSTNNTQLISAGYKGAFDPTNFCTNYLGDPGQSPASNADATYRVNLASGQSLNVVIWEVAAGGASTFNAGAGTPYTVKVDGLSAPNTPGSGPCPATLSTNAQPASTSLGNSISDRANLSTGGSPTGSITYKLFGPNNGTCAGTPIFTSVVPVNGDGTYSSQSFAPNAIGTYNWIASYSGDANNPATSGACGDANESTTVTAAPTPTATPTATATATATATPTATPASQTLNLSTRMRTDTGNNVGIGGFTITGSVPKHVLIRAIGPSLTKFGFTAAEVLADPTLEVHGPGAFGTITNNNWRDSQEAQIKADGLAPTNDLESAIDATLPPGAYTAIVSGNTGTTPAGICLFEVYDLDTAALSKLANLSTRAFVGTGNNVVIAGFVLGNNSGNDRVVIRGLGPSLSSFGIANTLADPTLELRDENGTLLVADNDWQDDPVQAADITAAGLAPSNAKESAIAATLPPGLYTAILAGLNGGTGVGTVEVYDRGP